MTDGDGPRGFGLDARLDRLERELARLGGELAAVRALVTTQPAARPAPVPAEPAAPATAGVAPPEPASAQPAAERGMPRWPPKPAQKPVPAAARAVPTPAAPTPPRAPARPPAPPPPPGRTLGELARDWDLVGARGFAIAGGAVMALGIGFFFVLAANRGWIDERARVALGAVASTLVFGAGIVLRARYGQYWSALAAVGAGIAGAYATLAAAAARYDLVPDPVALPLAGAIAAVGTVAALRFESQTIAAIGLLGAALAPALQAVDTDMTWEAGAFAVVVLTAAGAVAVPRRWDALLVAASLVVAGQVEWLVAEPPPVGRGTVAVGAAFVLCLLGIAVGRQMGAARVEVDPLALSYALASFGVTLAFATQLFDERADRGIALLVAASVWGLVFAALQLRTRPDLGAVVGVSALALAAVGTADLLSDSALTLAWAAQALTLAALAWRLRDARLQAMGAVYALLATVHALATEARPSLIFDAAGDQAPGVLPLASVALAMAATGAFAPGEHVARGESGPLAFVAAIRKALATRRRGFRETAFVAGAALGTLAASFALVSASFERGHIASTVLAAAVGGAILALAGRLRADRPAVAGYVWLGVVLAVAFAFHVDEFYDDVAGVSSGGWSVLAAAAGLLGGASAHRLAWPGTRARDLVFGASVVGAAVAFVLGVSFLAADARPWGLGVLGAAAVYVLLAAAFTFGREDSRDASTVLWSTGLVLLVASELALVTDAVWRSAAVAVTALVVGALAPALREWRLWLAGGSLAVATSLAVLLGQVQPWRGEGELETRLAIASSALVLAAVGLVALGRHRSHWRDLTTVLWLNGLVMLLATERVLLDDWRATTFAVALTGGLVALLAGRVGEVRLWYAGGLVVALATVSTVSEFTPVQHFFQSSESPAGGLWVLLACIAGLAVVGLTSPDGRLRVVLEAIAAGLALYALSLGILELAERVSGASVETDFERGHTAVSALWASLGLALLVLGLLRGSALVRYGGLALFGLSLAKIFLYDLASLSSIARAFSFILVGGLLLAGGFFLQRLSDRFGPGPPRAPLGV